MKTRNQPVVALLIWMTLALSPGCEMFDRNGHDDTARDSRGMHQGADIQQKVAVANVRPSKAATTQPALNNVTGMLTFTEMPGERVRVTGEIRGLKPDTEHGFHIHEKGDLSAADLSSAGPHFNPTGDTHGGPKPPHHVGDLGNIKASAQGVANVEVVIENATLQGRHALVGRSVIVHAGRDDLKTDPAGDSGARVAGGVIEMKK